MTDRAWIKKLLKLNPCSEAVEYARSYETLDAAWQDCARGDWMLWLIGKRDTGETSRKRLVLAACACARTALQYIPDGENRPLIAIETAEKWARGEEGVTLDQVRIAANAANAGYAAYAAGYAAYAAYAAGYAAYAAGYAAYAADAAYKAARKACADIVRKHYPKAPEGA